jgi:hypothetical protein
VLQRGRGQATLKINENINDPSTATAAKINGRAAI